MKTREEVQQRLADTTELIRIAYNELDLIPMHHKVEYQVQLSEIFSLTSQERILKWALE